MSVILLIKAIKNNKTFDEIQILIDNLSKGEIHRPVEVEILEHETYSPYSVGSHKLSLIHIALLYIKDQKTRHLVIDHFLAKAKREGKQKDLLEMKDDLQRTPEALANSIGNQSRENIQYIATREYLKGKLYALKPPEKFQLKSERSILDNPTIYYGLWGLAIGAMAVVLLGAAIGITILTGGVAAIPIISAAPIIAVGITSALTAIGIMATGFFLGATIGKPLHDRVASIKKVNAENTPANLTKKIVGGSTNVIHEKINPLDTIGLIAQIPSEDVVAEQPHKREAALLRTQIYLSSIDDTNLPFTSSITELQSFLSKKTSHQWGILTTNLLNAVLTLCDENGKPEDVNTARMTLDELPNNILSVMVVDNIERENKQEKAGKAAERVKGKDHPTTELIKIMEKLHGVYNQNKNTLPNVLAATESKTRMDDGITIKRRR